MPDYAALATTAKRLIDNAGRSVTFRARAGEKDPARPWLGKAAASSVGTGIGVFIEFTNAEIDGTLVRQEDRRLLVASKDLGFEPTADHEVVDESDVYQIVRAAQLKPGATSILWDLQVRA